jgi:hypothetical protein
MRASASCASTTTDGNEGAVFVAVTANELAGRDGNRAGGGAFDSGIIRSSTRTTGTSPMAEATDAEAEAATEAASSRVCTVPLDLPFSHHPKPATASKAITKARRTIPPASLPLNR